MEREGTRIYNGIVLRMVLIDTPGYGANKEIGEWYQMIKTYVTKQVKLFSYTKI
jgi:GTP-binding protein EngB required for normal cell division